MKFSDQLWQSISPIFQQIIQHPFNIELADGTLERKRFDFYLEQDVHYLLSYSRAIAFITARIESPNDVQWFVNFAVKAIAERQLLTNFFPENHNWNHFEPSRAYVSYTQHLIATASTATVEEAVAAILPCLWIYREVGRHASATAITPNPYIDWIQAYDNPEFSEDTEQAIAILNRLASHCSPTQLTKMKKAFEHSALFEWHFWNDSYHMTTFHNSINALHSPKDTSAKHFICN